MKKYQLLAAGLALMLGLGSCSNNEVSTADSSQPSEGMIRFSIGGSGDVTRTATQTANEQKVSQLYVVSYKNGAMKAVAHATFDSGTSKYEANVGASGVLELYFIANPSPALVTAMEDLAVGSTASELLALTHAVAPAVDGTEDNFLMTAYETKTVRSTQTTGDDLGSIELTRAAVRIDITSVPSGFTLEKVTFKNRYTATKLGRENTDLDMTGLACNTTGQEYTADITSGTTTTYTEHIYGYEDPNGTAQIVIDGKYNGLTLNGIVVNFATAGAESTPLPLKRNNAYEISLSPTNPDQALQTLTATITVKDWTTGATLAQTNVDLTDASSAPTVAFSDHSNCSTNTGNIDVTDNAAASFKVTVTNPGKTLSKLVCRQLVVGGGSPILTGEGITITPGDVTYNNNGTSTQEFTVAITANATGAQRVFTIQAENMLNRDANATFTVTQPAS